MYKKIMIAFVVFLTVVTTTANAAKFNIMTCIGMEDASHGSKVWKIVLDVKGGKLIVDGDVLDVDVYSKKIPAVYTINFVNSAGVYVYDSLILHKGRYYFAQYKVVENKLSSVIEVSCHVDK